MLTDQIPKEQNEHKLALGKRKRSFLVWRVSIPVISSSLVITYLECSMF